MRTDWLLNDEGDLDGGSDWFQGMEELTSQTLSAALARSICIIMKIDQNISLTVQTSFVYLLRKLF